MRNLAKHLPDSSGFDLKHILVDPGKTISLKKDFDPAYSGNFKDKEETLTELGLNIEQLACQQDILYANDTYALLVVLQALDAAGKDSTIKHVMSGVNHKDARCTVLRHLPKKNLITTICGAQPNAYRDAEPSVSSIGLITRRS